MTDSTLFLNKTQDIRIDTLLLTSLWGRIVFYLFCSIFSKPKLRTKYSAETTSPYNANFVILFEVESVGQRSGIFDFDFIDFLSFVTMLTSHEIRF